MLHQVHLINELKELPPQDGWPRYEATGRACVVCPCGLTTGFIDAREACQQFSSHAQEHEGNTSLAIQPKPSVTMDSSGLTLQS